MWPHTSGTSDGHSARGRAIDAPNHCSFPHYRCQFANGPVPHGCEKKLPPFLICAVGCQRPHQSTTAVDYDVLDCRPRRGMATIGKAFAPTPSTVLIGSGAMLIRLLREHDHAFGPDEIPALVAGLRGHARRARSRQSRRPCDIADRQNDHRSRQGRRARPRSDCVRRSERCRDKWWRPRWVLFSASTNGAGARRPHERRARPLGAETEARARGLQPP
jgi:hypothetical protein